MFNAFMHPRNPFRAQSDFVQLASQYPAFRALSQSHLDGRVTINFQDREAVRVLSQTLLQARLGLSVHIPPQSLVPTLPLRMNYLLWLEDMIKDNADHWGSGPIWGLDTGVGACAIYPLLGSRQFGWNFIGTDVDDAALHSAQQNLDRNRLDSQVLLVHQADPHTTPFFATPVARVPEHRLHFTLCNPPFFEAPSTPATRDDKFSSRAAPKPALAQPAGADHEIQTRGGEVGFVARMMEESVDYQAQIAIFTCMIGHKANLETLRRKLYSLRASHALKFIFTEFCQGSRLRWGVAWTFQPAVKLTDTSLRKKREKPYEVEVELIGKPVAIPSCQTFFQLFSTWMSDIAVDVTESSVSPECITCSISSYQTGWRHQRRRRREMDRLQADDADPEPPSKKMRIQEDDTPNGGNEEIQIRCTLTIRHQSDLNYGLKMKFEEGALGKVATHEVLTYIRNKYKSVPD
eukprot:maker-scaffold135_size322082-snap-gene-0.15 protein:Tk07965 transcript:maker-scaffold135_size322082-snap-gene-0.15-mRNA-1 annotation:"methyltransferase 10 domain containing"